jgi:uncharacterized LabA/DUF88 family protein
MKNRMAVFVDGRNVHYRLVALGWPTEYDVLAFAEAIGTGQHFKLVAVYYYNATPLSKFTPEPAYGQQLRYYAHIEGQLGDRFRKGFLIEVDGRPVEKQVDVKLALDLALCAARDEYDIAALVSADGDLGAAVEEVHRAGKRVINYVFRMKRSFNLAQVCDDVRFLKRKHFTPVQYPEEPASSD